MYTVKFYQGDYAERQRQANADGCKAYIEHHFNSSEGAGNYAVAITGSNASHTSKNWGRWYAGAVARDFNIPLGGDQGIVVGGFNGRGDFNLKYTNMPAILVEPLFGSNPQHAEWIRSEGGQDRLARILFESIRNFFPEGGTIAFSVGHKYKTSAPNDRGASIVGGGYEADYAEKVLQKAKSLLEGATAPEEGRKIKVMRDGEELWETTVDPDADVRWDPVRGVLQLG